MASTIGAVIARIEAALEVGITLFDTADIYGTGAPICFGGAETLLGRALARRPHLRARMVIATKGGIWPGAPYNSTVSYLSAAIEASLERLGVDHVELYQIQRRDFLAHPRDVVEALVAMVETGKVFAKLKHLMRKAAERTADATWKRIGTLLDEFPPTECAAYLANSGYART